MAPAALPTHPTLVHPRTGEPLRAIFVHPKTGRIYWPILGAEDGGGSTGAGSGADSGAGAASGDGGGTGSGASSQSGGQGSASSTETGFPANTPIEQMTGEQREAYWKHQARKHEDRVKALGGLTVDQLAELRTKAEKHDALEFELSTEAEKAAKKAADEARTATRAEVEPQLISARLDAAAARAGVSEEDLAKAVEFIDTRKFLATDGTIDTDKVKAFVATITPAKGTQQQQRPGPSSRGQGGSSSRAGDERNSLSAGRDAYRSRYRRADKATSNT